MQRQNERRAGVDSLPGDAGAGYSPRMPDPSVAASKRLVLCEPPYMFWDRSMDRLREGEETIPGMGMLVLAAVARERGYAVELIDAKGQGTTFDEVCARIIAARPDYLGLSATTISVTNAARIAERIKT